MILIRTINKNVASKGMMKVLRIYISYMKLFQDGTYEFSGINSIIGQLRITEKWEGAVAWPDHQFEGYNVYDEAHIRLVKVDTRPRGRGREEDATGMVSDQSGFGERNLTRFHLSVLLFDIFIALTIGFHKELEDYIKSVIWRPKEKKKEETKGEPHHMGKDEKLSTQIHGEEPFHPMQPWAGLKLPVEVDNALQEVRPFIYKLLSLVLSQYIYNWYSDLSDDKAFVHELQVGFRHVLANLYRRARKVDVCKLILEKLIPTGMMHLDCYLHGRSCSEQERNVEQATLDYYGSHLHVALKHGNERKALKPLCCEILSETILFPSLNALADPDVVNSLLVLLFSPSVPDPPESMNQPWVNFLENFVSKYADAIPPPLTLKDVRNNPTFLQYFWDFLKDEKANNLMQFLLDVEELNQRLLNPDLDAKGQQQLHVEAKSLFHTYFVPGGDDYICFASEVQKEIQSIVEGPTEGVEALRRGNSLFKAYEHVYNLLEGVYCPLFQHSNVSFSLKWGPRLCDPAAKNISKSASRKGVRVGRRIDRLKGVVLPQPSEGQAFDLYSEVDFSEEVIIVSSSDKPFLAALPLDDDISLEDELPDSITTRDLSAWRVSVPSVDERLDFSHKSFFVYIIDVRRIDIKDGESEEEMRWQVERRYEEFYVLEAKLTEFHGEFSDLRLPPKSTLFGSRGLELMKSRRAVLEEYLQKLLQKPNLRGSELIFSFLTSQYPFTSSFLPDLNLGRMFRSVPIRLRKERGQNLEPFLASFIASTEPPKPKPSKLDMGEMIYEESGETRGELRAKGSVGRTSEESRSLYPMSLNGIYDIIVFLGVRVFAFSSWLLQILLFLRSFVHEAFNAWAERLLRKKLEESLTPHKISLVIHFIRDTVFFEGSQSRTDIEKLARSGDALRGMREIFPPWLKKQIGIDHLDSGTKLIFSVLQHPRLNKQLELHVQTDAGNVHGSPKELSRVRRVIQAKRDSKSLRLLTKPCNSMSLELVPEMSRWRRLGNPNRHDKATQYVQIITFDNWREKYAWRRRIKAWQNAPAREKKLLTDITDPTTILNPSYGLLARKYFDDHEGHKCGYCGSKDANFSKGMWAHDLTVQDYQRLIDRGWRRSGKYCYKPTMNQTCCPQYTIRCPAESLQLSKSQKKVMKRMTKYLATGSTKDDEHNQQGESSFDDDRKMAGEEVQQEEHPIDGDGSLELLDAKAIEMEEKSIEKPKFKTIGSLGESRLRSNDDTGVGPDPSKPPCKKARLRRLERRKKDIKSILPRSTKNEHKTLEDFIKETLPAHPVHHLKVKLVKVGSREFKESFDQEYAVYRRYQIGIHRDPTSRCTPKQFTRFLVDSPLQLEEGPLEGYGSYHMQYWLDGSIIAVGVLDVLPLCLSSVYLFYDPRFSFLSLGTYSSLRADGSNDDTGVGPDPSKPPCKKARLRRLERRKKDIKSILPRSTKNEHKTLEDFIKETLPAHPVHHLKVKLVKVGSREFKESFDQEYAVYRRYQIGIHRDPTSRCTPKQFTRFLVDSPLQLEEGPLEGYGSYHMQYWLDGSIIAVGVLDVLPLCLSSVYLFYDPRFSFLSLGTYSSLRELALVRELCQSFPRLQFYYMGYYIHSCPKMRYKGQYSPSYLLCPETYTWHPMERCRSLLNANRYSRFHPDESVEDPDGRVELNQVLVLWKSKVMPYPLYKSMSHMEDEGFVREYADLVGSKCAASILLYQIKL
ncbi:unnamed protein product [Darwinula stevensoni]|uniref:arginyltransferase n=1 Tax=Darwinula stevensoni TaxID=69355 RepID=A0A7R8X175_9CRUS|nr:unnamed protein product [Darwinula stevensoni]CAG0881958.1 unnamed protein product [Darwinula stevensoni]